MNVDNFIPICVGTLNSFFKDIEHPGDKTVVKGLICCNCHQATDISVVKTESGFGILNGYLSEPQKGEMFVICESCASNLKSKRIAP